jgi:hypothetical protein
MRPFNEIWDEWTTEHVGDLRVSVSPMKPGESGLFWDIDELQGSQKNHTWVKIEERIGQGRVSNFLRGNRAACYQGSGNLPGKYHPERCQKELL